MVIAVDFDGTIVTHEYPAVGKEIPFAIDTLKRFQTEFHHTLILWTVREGETLEEAIEFCRERGLEFYAVNANYPEEDFSPGFSRKINADLYIDDRSLGGIPEWGIIYRMVATGKYNMPPVYELESEYKKEKKRFFKLFSKK